MQHCELGALYIEGLTGDYHKARIMVILFAEPRWKIRPGWRIYFSTMMGGGAGRRSSKVHWLRRWSLSIWKQSWMAWADSRLILCTPFYRQASNSQRILQYRNSGVRDKSLGPISLFLFSDCGSFIMPQLLNFQRIKSEDGTWLWSPNQLYSMKFLFKQILIKKVFIPSNFNIIFHNSVNFMS